MKDKGRFQSRRYGQMDSRKVQAMSGKARERAEQRSRWDRRGQNETKTKC